MWGRDPLAEALGIAQSKAEAEAQQIARAMFQGVVPAGVVQLPRFFEAHPISAVTDQAGQILTPEERARRCAGRAPYRPGQLRDYQAEMDATVPETDYSAPDAYTPQLPRLCRETGAAIRGIDFTEHPREAGLLPAAPRPPPAPVEPPPYRDPVLDLVLASLQGFLQ